MLTLRLRKELSAGYSIKYLFLLIIFSTLSLTASGQVDYFDVEGNWAGNDANGNAVIKWTITICAGDDGAVGVTVRVPSNERDETQSGATGISDEDSPADDEVCTGSWNNPGGSTGCTGQDWDNYRPADYQTTGILADDAVLCANQCAEYTWTTYSKDYDSNTTDYDH